MKRYKVTCLKCKKSDVAIIDENSKSLIGFEKSMATNFLSIRWRQDQSWGFECECGNDSRISKQEEKFMHQLVDPRTPKVGIEAIKASLKIEDSKKFTMVGV